MSKSKQIQEKDGKESLCCDSVVNMSKMATQDKDKLKKIEEVCEECKPVEHEDRCEYTALLVKCFEDKGANLGF